MWLYHAEKQSDNADSAAPAEVLPRTASAACLLKQEGIFALPDKFDRNQKTETEKFFLQPAYE